MVKLTNVIIFNHIHNKLKCKTNFFFILQSRENTDMSPILNLPSSIKDILF